MYVEISQKTRIDNTNYNSKKSPDIDQMLSDVRSNNPSNLNFCYFNINSVSG